MNKNMKKMAMMVMTALCCLSCGNSAQKTANADEQNDETKATVYLTREISPESLVKIYKALGREAKGRVAVKISTGEAGNPNYLKPDRKSTRLNSSHAT